MGEGAGASGLWHAADEATGGAVTRAFAAAEFTGKEGTSCMILAPGAGLSRIVAAGLGKEADFSERRCEEAAGLMAASTCTRGNCWHVAADGVTGKHAAHAALGAVLRSYRFDLYRTKQKPEDKPKFSALTVLTGERAGAEAAWPALRAIAHGTFVTRDLVTEPANVLEPAGVRHPDREAERTGSDHRGVWQAGARGAGFRLASGGGPGQRAPGAHGGDAAGTAALRARSRWRSSARA